MGRNLAGRFQQSKSDTIALADGGIKPSFIWEIVDVHMHDVISRYELLERGAKGLERSRFAGCMVQLLPVLRKAIEELFPDVELKLSMLAVELRLPNASQVIAIQCVGENCLFRVTFMNHQYQVMQEQIVDLSNAVEQVIKYLEMSKA